MDKSLNKFLGLDDSYKADPSSLFKLAMIFKKITNSDRPISKISLVYYKEEKGDFMESKRGEKKIVKDIFDNLDKEDQFDLLLYWS